MFVKRSLIIAGALEADAALFELIALVVLGMMLAILRQEQVRDLAELDEQKRCPKLKPGKASWRWRDLQLSMREVPLRVFDRAIVFWAVVSGLFHIFVDGTFAVSP